MKLLVQGNFFVLILLSIPVIFFNCCNTGAQLNYASAFPAACGGVSEHKINMQLIDDSSRLAARRINLIPLDQDLPLNNNMPELAWEPVSCDRYEIWIDGLKMDEVGSTHASYTAFPLSFGKHSWKVVAVQGENRMICYR